MKSYVASLHHVHRASKPKINEKYNSHCVVVRSQSQEANKTTGCHDEKTIRTSHRPRPEEVRNKSAESPRNPIGPSTPKFVRKDRHLEKKTSDRAKQDAKRSGLSWHENTSQAIMRRDKYQEIARSSRQTDRDRAANRCAEAHL